MSQRGCAGDEALARALQASFDAEAVVETFKGPLLGALLGPYWDLIGGCWGGVGD